MKKYYTLLLENVSISLDDIMSILRNLKETDEILFKELVKKHKDKIINDIIRQNLSLLIEFHEMLDDKSLPSSLFKKCKKSACIKKLLKLGVSPKGEDVIYMHYNYNKIFDPELFTLLYRSGSKIEGTNSILQLAEKYDEFIYFYNLGADINKYKLTNYFELYSKSHLISFFKIINFLKKENLFEKFMKRSNPSLYSIIKLNSNYFEQFILAFKKYINPIEIYSYFGSSLSELDYITKMSILIKITKDIKLYMKIKEEYNNGYATKKILNEMGVIVNDYSYLEQVGQFNI